MIAGKDIPTDTKYKAAPLLADCRKSAAAFFYRKCATGASICSCLMGRIGMTDFG